MFGGLSDILSRDKVDFRTLLGKDLMIREGYVKLLKALRALSIHSVIGGIALPNPASVALSEKFEFQRVAHFREVGFKLDSWVDVGYWELVL
jgi:L-amino acid N-acyltransferase YncA